MSKYIKLEDALNCVNGYFLTAIHKAIESLPTIEISEDCISREYVIEKLKSSKEFFLSAWGGFSNMDDKDKARCDELNNCISIVFNAPSVVPTQTNAIQRVEYVGENEMKRCRTCKHFENGFHTPISSNGTYYSYVICTAKECNYESVDPPQTEER